MCSLHGSRNIVVVRIGSNIASLKAQRSLSNNTDALSTTFERLSSGMRINRASDDAAGLSVATTLRADARIYTQGIRNVNDGMSVLSIAEGALGQLSGIVTRQIELAEQAANGSYSTNQRRSLNSEMNALVNEFNRIVQSTSYNRRNLLDGSFANLLIQAGSGNNSTLGLNVGSEFSRSVGDGTFGTRISFAGGTTEGVVTGDFNGDGNMDKAWAIDAAANNIFIQMGNGDGSFLATQTYTAYRATQIATADLNNDGKLDLVTVTEGQGYGFTLMNSGTGTFGTARTFTGYGADHEALVLGDLNGDGIMDMVTSSFSDTTHSSLIGNGDGTFRRVAGYTSGLNTVASTLADINNDGKLDLIYNGSDTKTRYRLGVGDGTFGAEVSFAHISGQGSVGVYDVNGDGFMDIVAANTGGASISVSFGNGNGTFGAVTSYTGFTGNSDILIRDINGDGVADILSSNYGTGQIAVFLGNSNGTFQAPTTVAAGTSIVGYSLADFNNDGALDIFSGSKQGAGTVDTFFGNAHDVYTIGIYNITTRQGALDALTTARSHLDRISLELGSIGAFSSRMRVASNNLLTSSENFLAAESRIMDADVAEESADLIRRQILQKTAVAVLAQANVQPSLALTLLRN